MQDIVGSIKMMAHNEVMTLPTFRSCSEIMENPFQEHGGQIFYTGGDPVHAMVQPV